MPTRKQRRREAKQKRHEYEFVYVDSEGNELEEPPEGLEPEAERGAGRRNGKPAEASKPRSKAQQQRGGRSLRTPQPPSWRRAARRALILGAVVFALFYAGGKGTHRVYSAARLAALYTLLFVPFTYAVDRFTYNRFQRRHEAASSGDKGSATKKR
jgi:hypothetical protein